MRRLSLEDFWKTSGRLMEDSQKTYGRLLEDLWKTDITQITLKSEFTLSNKMFNWSTQGSNPQGATEPNESNMIC